MATITGTFNSLVSGTLSGVIGTPGPTGSTGPQGPAGPTFTGGAITSPITYTVGTNTTVFENGDIYTENTASGAYGVVYINGLEASDGTHTLAMTASGITFGDASVQSTAFPGSAAFYPATGNPSGFLTSAPVTSVAGRTGAITLSNTDISGLGTMATATASDYSTTTAANALYYPLSGNPSAFLTDAPSDGSQYARQDGAWSVVTGGGGGSYLPLAGGTMTGPIVFDGTSGQYISKGNFDTSRGGNYGISLVCSIGYEFNWQAGWLTTTNQGSVTPRPLYLDSLAGTTLRAWNSETNFGTEVSYSGITMAETTNTVSLNPFGITASNTGTDNTSIVAGEISLTDGSANNLQTSTFIQLDVPGEDPGLVRPKVDLTASALTFQLEDEVPGSIYAASGITFPDATTQTSAAFVPGSGDLDLDGYAITDGNFNSPAGQVSAQNVTLSSGGVLTFGDSTTQSSAGLTDAPSDGTTYGRNNGSWVVAGGGGGAGPLTNISPTNGQQFTSADFGKLIYLYYDFATITYLDFTGVTGFGYIHVINNSEQDIYIVGQSSNAITANYALLKRGYIGRIYFNGYSYFFDKEPPFVGGATPWTQLSLGGVTGNEDIGTDDDGNTMYIYTYSSVRVDGDASGGIRTDQPGTQPYGTNISDGGPWVVSGTTGFWYSNGTGGRYFA